MRGLRRVAKPKAPKPRPGLDDPAHRQRVRQLRCLLSGKRVQLTRWKGVYPHTEQVTETYQHVCEGRVEFHHAVKKSQLGHDHTGVPLCRIAHSEAHRLGNKLFKEIWGIDLLEEAAKLAP